MFHSLSSKSCLCLFVGTNVSGFGVSLCFSFVISHVFVFFACLLFMSFDFFKAKRLVLFSLLLLVP